MNFEALDENGRPIEGMDPERVRIMHQFCISVPEMRKSYYRTMKKAQAEGVRSSHILCDEQGVDFPKGEATHVKRINGKTGKATITQIKAICTYNWVLCPGPGAQPTPLDGEAVKQRVREVLKNGV